MWKRVQLQVFSYCASETLCQTRDRLTKGEALATQRAFHKHARSPCPLQTHHLLLLPTVAAVLSTSAPQVLSNQHTCCATELVWSAEAKTRIPIQNRGQSWLLLSARIAPSIHESLVLDPSMAECSWRDCQQQDKCVGGEPQDITL